MTTNQMKKKIFVDNLGRKLSVNDICLPLGYESSPESTENERQRQISLPFNEFKKLAIQNGFKVI